MKTKNKKTRLDYKYVLALRYKGGFEHFIGCKNLDTLALILVGVFDGKTQVNGFQVAELAKAKKLGWTKMVYEVADALKDNKKPKRGKR